MTKIPRIIAFYLPQYHPIPENDAWWGKGFTEWTNVVKAKSLFKGHYQPHIPADLGFYDLRIPEVRETQAELARQHGIFGFCYWHYWFSGKQLLERPFNEVLMSGKPDFPFCLCWANENWTRTWDQKDDHILIKQEYSEKDDREHIRSLIPALLDDRYIKHEEKPVLMIYRLSNMPFPRRTTDVWREEYLKLGYGELYLCKIEGSGKDRDHEDPIKDGFDAAVEFQPDTRLYYSLKRRGKVWRILTKLGFSSEVYQKNVILDYKDLVERSITKPNPGYLRYPCVTPGFDNSPRKVAKCGIIINSTPELYEYWLTSVIKNPRSTPQMSDLIFVNAWNEWAEGNHLEPDLRFGKGFLEATKRVIDNAQNGNLT